MRIQNDLKWGWLIYHGFESKYLGNNRVAQKRCPNIALSVDMYNACFQAEI